jgi:ankyrin repeat protein
MIGRILGAGGDYTKKNSDGLQPIHLAAMAGQLEAIKSLVHSGADINAKDSSGLTPLHHAAQLTTSSVSSVPSSALSSRRSSAATRQSTLRFSYVFGAQLEKTHSRKPSQTSVSSSVSEERSCSLVEALLRCGASTEVRDRHGNSPLHLAVLAGSVQNMTALLDQGANIHARNKAGLTPLGVLAVSEESNETLSKFLLDRGAVEMPFEEKSHHWFKKASL